MYKVLLILFLTIALCSCSPEQEQAEPQADGSVQPQAPQQQPGPEKGCRSCHAMTLDTPHDLSCIVCHAGVDDLEEKDKSHEGLITRPAHPDNMQKSCGPCHQEQVQNSAHSLHFTLKKKVNQVRTAFGATKELDSLTDIPVIENPQSILDLTDDLLRRRCLRCHLYTSGDRYPAVTRGTGCAACHLEFYEGKLVSHSFLKTPGDTQCLQCHYGNWVGYDYYGRYEHDMNDEYRTPYTTRNDYFRPFGVEFHQLVPDVHQQKGMTCVDCHSGNQLMGKQEKGIRCADCHSKGKLESETLPPNISRIENAYTLRSHNGNILHDIPLLTHPAHDIYGKSVSCQVCHAQWSFNDQKTHLLRSDIDDYDSFARLTVQGSSEIEKLLNNNLDFDAEELPHGMTDKISGQFRAGIWYKGLVTRRWETIPLGRDQSGRLRVLRPLLDLHLSWIDEDGEVHFDAVPSSSANDGMVPYVPHTTGKAGFFYKERIDKFLRSEIISKD
ncbi:MAG: hypothetical protein KKD01_03650 [Proteobacteria bacterium]|nr:hypothetical protein [Pseudomonadota bacterium]MBU1417103.1 hypothetical protein [Pseudomonadota bacterium]MBU1453799.1 hypothetical protein [Pseudomonadota bacterium]